jgi:hypothetical protein
VAEFENCRILLVDKKISTARDIVGILEAAVRGGFSLLIMAEDIEQEALATMVVNKLRGTLKVRLLLALAAAVLEIDGCIRVSPAPCPSRHWNGLLCLESRLEKPLSWRHIKLNIKTNVLWDLHLC